MHVAVGLPIRITQFGRTQLSLKATASPDSLDRPLRHQRCIAVQRASVPGVLVCEGPSQGLIRRLVDERIGWVRPDVWIPTLQDLPDMSRHAHNLKEVPT